MRCVDCELHDYVVSTHFCNYKGKSGRRRPRRISEEDAHKDVPCEYVEELKGADDNRDYERAAEQREYDMLYESTYNPEDGSM